MKRILLAFALMSAVSGCVRKYEPDAAFLERDVLSLEMDGSSVVEYEPETWQVGFSRENRQFRVHNDTMSEYYVLTCSALPDHVGQKLTCSLKYASYKVAVYKSGMEFEVKKMDDNGVIWLWNSRKRVGVTVKELR